MHTVTCHTDGCANSGVPLQMNLSYTDDDGQEQTMGAACGVCGQPITDVTESEEP